MLYEFAFSCTGVGEESPFCLCQGFPRKLLPYSNQPIGSKVNDLLIFETAQSFELADPITFLPFDPKVCHKILHCLTCYIKILDPKENAACNELDVLKRGTYE